MPTPKTQQPEMSRHPERAYTFAQAITNNLPDAVLDCLGQVLVSNLNYEITKVRNRKTDFFDLAMELQELRRMTPSTQWGTAEARALQQTGSR